MFRRRLTRDQISTFVIQLPNCRDSQKCTPFSTSIILNETHSAFDQLTFLELIVRKWKNDGKDIDAKGKAMLHQTMRFIPIKMGRATRYSESASNSLSPDQ